MVAVVQARMNSTRLPGKALADIGGRPLILALLERVSRSRLLDEIVVATTDQATDDILSTTLVEAGANVFRGSLDDVLGRVVEAARGRSASVVVRLTADNPFVDGGLIDEALTAFATEKPSPDILTTVGSTWPTGLSVEVANASVLAEAASISTDPAEREHVTLHLYRHPSRYSVLRLRPLLDRPAYRLTVDEPRDLAFTREVFAHFPTLGFSWQEAISFLDSRPDVVAINQAVAQRTV